MSDRVTTNDYEQFVVVDETEWKFDYGNYECETVRKDICCRCGLQESPNCASCGQQNKKKKCLCGHDSTDCSSCARQILILTTNPPRNVKHSLKMGTIEWNMTLHQQAKTLQFTCQTVAEGETDDEVHMELVQHFRWNTNESYKYKGTKRHIFSRTTNSCSIRLVKAYMEDKPFTDNLFTIRILKSRSMFPDFTLLESTVVGPIRYNDAKLRVVDQVFHVNKQFLSMHSEYFGLLYKDNFKEANQEEVELKHDQADPAVFHDFLLVLYVAEALPNPNNLSALSHLANIYRTKNVREKCHRHLGMCREMPVEERYMLAGELGLNGLQTSIKKNANFDERERIIDAFSKKAFAHTK